MNDLVNKKCVPCEGGILPFDISDIYKYQKKYTFFNASVLVFFVFLLWPEPKLVGTAMCPM